MNDLQEIERLNQQNEQATNQGEELTAQVRVLEFETSKTVNRTEELNRQIDQKTYELKQKEQQVQDCEREMNSLKNQLSSFVNELHHLKALEQRYKDENADLHRRTDQESSQNLELVAQLKEIEIKIRSKEDQVMYLKRELEGAKYSNAALIESNANL